MYKLKFNLLKAKPELKLRLTVFFKDNDNKDLKEFYLAIKIE